METRDAVMESKIKYLLKARRAKNQGTKTTTTRRAKRELTLNIKSPSFGRGKSVRSQAGRSPYYQAPAPAGAPPAEFHNPKYAPALDTIPTAFSTIVGSSWVWAWAWAWLRCEISPSTPCSLAVPVGDRGTGGVRAGTDIGGLRFELGLGFDDSVGESGFILLGCCRAGVDSAIGTRLSVPMTGELAGVGAEGAGPAFSFPAFFEGRGVVTTSTSGRLRIPTTGEFAGVGVGVADVGGESSTASASSSSSMGLGIPSGVGTTCNNPSLAGPAPFT